MMALLYVLIRLGRDSSLFRLEGFGQPVSTGDRRFGQTSLDEQQRAYSELGTPERVRRRSLLREDRFCHILNRP
jgi:hypothetical protein